MVDIHFKMSAVRQRRGMMEKYGVVTDDGLTKHGERGDRRCPSCGAKLVTLKPAICPNCGSLPMERDDGKKEEGGSEAKEE